MYNFQFAKCDGTIVTSSFSIVPITFPSVSSSYTLMGDPLTFASGGMVDLIPVDSFKIELNLQSTNDWYITLNTGSSVTASLSIVSGSYISASLCSVTFNLIDFVRNYESVKSVEIKPVYENVGWKQYFVLEDKIVNTTDTSGSFVVTLVPQTYTVNFKGTKKNTKYTILVPTTTSENANTLIVSSLTPAKTITPQNQALYSYTAQASDTRYLAYGEAIPSASWASSSLSSSYALSASWAPGGSTGNSDSASWASSSISASYLIPTNDYLVNTITASNSILIGSGADNSASLYISGSNTNRNLVEIDRYDGIEVLTINTSGSMVLSGSVNIGDTTINSTGSISIGTIDSKLTALNTSTVLSIARDTATQVQIAGASNTAVIAPAIKLARSRGTGAARIIVQEEDALGAINAFAYNGSVMSNLSSINFIAHGSQSAALVPQRITFQTKGTATSKASQWSILPGQYGELVSGIDGKGLQKIVSAGHIIGGRFGLGTEPAYSHVASNLLDIDNRFRTKIAIIISAIPADGDQIVFEYLPSTFWTWEWDNDATIISDSAVTIGATTTECAINLVAAMQNDITYTLGLGITVSNVGPTVYTIDDVPHSTVYDFSSTNPTTCSTVQVTAGTDSPYYYIDTNCDVYGTGKLQMVGTISSSNMICNGISGSLWLNTSSSIQFVTNSIYDQSGHMGRMYWDEKNKTVALCNSPDVTQQIGQEVLVRVVALENLPNGSAVYATTNSLVNPDTDSRRVVCGLAIADGTGHRSTLCGVATETIPSGSRGFITVIGNINGLNTDTLTEGDPIYLSTTQSGSFTSTRPTQPYEQVYAGTCIYKHASEGIISVNIANPPLVSLVSNAGMTALPVLSLTGSTVSCSVGGTVNLYNTVAGNDTCHNYFLPAADLSMPVTGSTYYVYADYNSGNPIYGITTDRNIITQTTIVNVASCIRTIYNDFEVLYHDNFGYALANKLNKRFIRSQRYGYEDGLLIGSSGSRAITVSAGNIWFGASSHYISSSNSGITPYRLFFHTAANVWSSSLFTQYNNTQYDNGSALTALGGGGSHWNVTWLYTALPDSDLMGVLGNADYTSLASAAASSQPPNLPAMLNQATGLAPLIGRIIVQKSATTIAQTDSNFTTILGAGSTTAHNSLGGLQGSGPDYYHLTTTEYNALGISSSYSVTASYSIDAVNAVSASYSTGSVIGFGINNILYITSASYAALSPKVATTLYIISSSI